MEVHKPEVQSYRISAIESKKFRSLEGIPSMQSLTKDGSKTGEQLL